MAKEKRIKKDREKDVKEKVCKFQFYKIGEGGLLVYGGDLIDPELKDPPEGYTEVPPPEGLYHPKWDGEDWIEGGTPPVVDPSVVPPPTFESLQAEIAELKSYIADLVDENKLKLPKVKPAKVAKGDKQP